MTVSTRKANRVFALVLLVLSGAMAGCSTGWNPHDDPARAPGSYQLAPDGYYRVKHGDTLHAIAFNFGKDWRDIASWNSIRAPYTIYPDQELRLTAPPGGSGRKSTATAEQSGGKVGTSTGVTVTKAAPPKGSGSKTYDAPVAAKPAPPVTTADPNAWMWPTKGRVISTFKPNDPARKGLDIGGKEGQAVIASAAGQVVYSGSGLLGYGELVIIKHSESLLSAYAHNRKRLVKEGDEVKAGQRIAEMGSNDRNQAMLHFEIRSNGNPQDPLKYLPGR